MGVEIIKPKAMTDEEKFEFTEAIETYVEKSLYDVKLDSYFKVPQENKIAFLQVTRKGWIKSRNIWGGRKKDANDNFVMVNKKKVWEDNNIQYIPVRKVERLLNFLFNFQWDSEVIGQGFEEVETITNKDKKTVVYDAYVMLKFSANFLGREIKRTVCGSFKMYENKATSRHAVIQACISQAKRNFAKEFGIGGDLNDEDLNAETRFSTKTDDPIDSKDIENTIGSDFK